MTSATQPSPSPAAHVRQAFSQLVRRRRALGIGAALLLLLIVAFYAWLPGFAKSRLEALLAEQLQRPVSIASLTLHPLTLEASVRGLKVAGEPAAPQPVPTAPGNPKQAQATPLLFSLEALHIDLSAQSLWQRAPVVSSLRLDQPVLHLTRGKDGKLSIDDIVRHWANRPAKNDNQGGKTYFSLNNIVLDGGRIEFADHLGPGARTHVLSDIKLGIPFIANFDSAVDTWVEPHFSARINGAALTLEGKARPFSTKQEASMELKLADIDLAQFSGYAPLGGFQLEAARLDSLLHLGFQRENGKPAVKLSGNLKLRGVALQNRTAAQPWSARGDTIELALHDVDPLLQRPLHADLQTGKLEISKRGDKQTVASLKHLKLARISVDPQQRNIAIGSVGLADPNVAVTRGSDGHFDVEALLAPARTPAAAQNAGKTDTAAKAWTVALGGVQLTGGQVRYQDATHGLETPLLLSALEIKTGAVDVEGKTPVKLDVAATINGGGSLKATGTAAWAPLALALDVEAKDVDLAPLQGLADKPFNAVLTKGGASFNGQVKAGGAPLNVTLSGQARLANVNIADKPGGTDLVRFKALEMSDLAVATAPLKVEMATLVLNDFYSRLVVSPQGRLTIKDVLRQDAAPSEQKEAQRVATAAPAAPKPAQASAPAKPSSLPIRINQVLLQNGSVNFSDNFIKPNYRANLTNLSGKIGPLAPGKLGQVELKGAIDQSAPLQITGKVDPFGSELFLDIAANARGIDLPRFSPYSGKYIGYEIAKGKLSVDVRYYVEKGQLKADNRLVLNQLVFGKKVDSPSAMSIPVHLAVAVLKNADGAIDLNLPVSGSLSDPQFSIGGVLANAFGNLLLKAVTSPFALLGALFEHEGELSKLEFAPGRARLTPDAEKRLQTLADALVKRPALTLDITGVADPATERDAYRRAVLERRVKAQKLAQLSPKEQQGVNVNDVQLSAEEYQKYLELAYKKENIDKPRNLLGLTKRLPPQEMEQLIMASLPAGEDELRNLADRRARAARDWLVARGVPVERVFLLAPRVESAEEGKAAAGRVEFALR